MDDHALFCSLLDQHAPLSLATQRMGSCQKMGNASSPPKGDLALSPNTTRLKEDDELTAFFAIAAVEMSLVGSKHTDEDAMKQHYDWLVQYQDRMQERADLLDLVRQARESQRAEGIKNAWGEN